MLEFADTIFDTFLTTVSRLEKFTHHSNIYMNIDVQLLQRRRNNKKSLQLVTVSTTMKKANKMLTNV